MANRLKRFDGFQVLRSVFDVDKNCLRVCVVEGTTGGGDGFEVVISHTNDSIRLGDGSNYFTSTTIGPKNGLDVNVINSVVVTATDLDIRDLNYLTDSVTSYSPTQSVRVDEVSKNLIYIGKATIGSLTSSAVWQIQRVTVTGTVTSTLWADGNASFDNIWDNRAILTYS